MALPQNNDGFPLRRLGPGEAPTHGLSSGGHGWMDQFAKNTWEQQKDPFGSTKPWDGKRRQNVPEDFAKVQTVSVTVILDAYTSSPMMRKILPLEITSAGYFEAKQWQFTPKIMGAHAYMAPYEILRGKQTSILTNLKQFILGLQSIDEMDLTEPGAFIRSQLYIALRASVELTILLQQTRALLMCPDIIAKQAEVAGNSNCSQQQVIERQIELFENTTLVLSRHAIVEDPLSILLFHTNKIIGTLRTNPQKVDFMVMQHALLDKFAINYTRQDFHGTVDDSVIQYILSTLSPNPAEYKLALPPISLIAMSGVTIAPVYPAISDNGPIDDLAGTLTTGHFSIVDLSTVDRVEVISYTARQRKHVIDRGVNGRDYAIRRAVYGEFYRMFPLPAFARQMNAADMNAVGNPEYDVANQYVAVQVVQDVLGPRSVINLIEHNDDEYGLVFQNPLPNGVGGVNSNDVITHMKFAVREFFRGADQISNGSTAAAEGVDGVRREWEQTLGALNALAVVPLNAGIANAAAFENAFHDFLAAFTDFVVRTTRYLMRLDLGTPAPRPVATRYNTFAYPGNNECNAHEYQTIDRIRHYPLRAIVFRQYGFTTSTIISGIGGGEAAGKTYIGRSAEGTSWNADRRTNDEYKILRVGVGIFQQNAIAPIRHAAIADYLWGGDALPLQLEHAWGPRSFNPTHPLAGYFYTTTDAYAQGINEARAGGNAQLGNGDTFMYLIPVNNNETIEEYAARCDALDRQAYLDCGGPLPFAQRCEEAFINNHTWSRVPTHLQRQNDDPDDERAIPSTLVWNSPSWQRKTGETEFSRCGAQRGLISHEPNSITSWTQASTPRPIAA